MVRSFLNAAGISGREGFGERECVCVCVCVVAGAWRGGLGCPINAKSRKGDRLQFSLGKLNL